jgi:hypothetical protein
MGEVLGAAILLVLLAAALAGAVYVLSGSARRTSLARTPLPALDPNDREAMAAKAGQYFRVAQSSARLLEGLLADDLVRAVLPDAKQAEMRILIDRFYEL